MLMQQRMMDQMENMEEKQERREERNERRQLQREMRHREMQLLISQQHITPYKAYPGHISSPDYSFKAPPPPPPPSNDPRTPTPRGSEAAPPVYTRPTRRSSPIDAAEEDAEILTSFFIWKLQNTRNVQRYAKWERARDIILQNDWSIHDLQAMEDGLSATYHRAIQAGISDGFARGFRNESREFKSIYRRQQGVPEAEAVQALNSLSSI
ncbi:hypothetical protein BDV12DRAFT_181089, partial [Aspergillus spectabilis]